MNSKFKSMPGIFICINHYKVISKLLVFLTIALLSVGFHKKVCFQTCNKWKGWDRDRGGSGGMEGGILIPSSNMYMFLYVHVLLKQIICKLEGLFSSTVC